MSSEHDREVAEHTLGKGEAFSRSLLQHVLDVVAVLDADGTLLYINSAVETMLGYAPEEVIGTTVFDYVHPDAVERAVGALAETLVTSGVLPPIEFRVCRADGTWRHVEVERNNRLDDPGVGGVVIIVRDVTERKKAEEALKESGERYRAVMEQSVEAIYLYDAETKLILESNDAFMKMMGYSEEELLGMRIYDFIDHDRDNIDQHVRRSLKEERRHIGERRYRRKDGSVILVDTSASVISYGGRMALCAVSRDVTERKEAEDQKARQARHAALRADVSAILAGGGTLHSILQRCTECMVLHLEAAFARIWTLDEEEKVLELQASAGIYTHLDGVHSRVPVGEYKIGLIAEERLPHLTNDVKDDPRISDKEWAEGEGMVAFAGYPLIVENRVVGVMAMFARQPLEEDTIEALASVADVIAQGIKRKVAEERLEHQALHDSLTNLPNR
jgi:PAS domain S-box-containing protein